MTGVIVCSIMLGIGILAMVYLQVIHPIVMTRPPVKKILDLVSRQDGFSLDHNPDNAGRYKHVPFSVDFVLHDTVNSTKTCMSVDGFSGCVMMDGEFEWMNEFERKRLHKVVYAIYKDRDRKYREACRIECEARNERDRQAAIKVYENR